MSEEIAKEFVKYTAACDFGEWSKVDRERERIREKKLQKWNFKWTRHTLLS